ncbi:MAG: hypothetical protein RL204_1596 [Bacteroidota bacterium]|jgi:hypothetical protein
MTLIREVMSKRPMINNDEVNGRITAQQIQCVVSLLNSQLLNTTGPEPQLNWRALVAAERVG